MINALVKAHEPLLSDPTETRLRLLENGFTPLPLVGKAPYVTNWSQISISQSTVLSWRGRGDAQNTGVRLGNGIMALDLDILDQRASAAAVEAMARVLPRNPFCRVGLAPKTLFLFRTSEPILKRTYYAKDGVTGQIDILGEGSQCVVDGIHPETHLPYEWIGGASPLTSRLKEVPEITLEQLQEVLRAISGWAMSLTDKNPRPSTGGGGLLDTSALPRNDAGKVTDGRESFLTSCVYHSLKSLVRERKEISEEAVAALSWERFCAQAEVSGDRWDSPTTYRKEVLGRAKRVVTKYRSGKLIGVTVVEASDLSVPPTYPDTGVPLLQAREAVKEPVEQFIRAVRGHAAGGSDFGAQHLAARVATAVGKTQAAVEAISKYRKETGDGRPFGFVVPTHKLGAEIEERFRALGVEARVFRGRNADNPEGGKMCQNLPAVEVAMALGASIQETCCKGKNPDTKQKVACPFFETCAYQAQRRQEPDIWVVPHTMLFVPDKLFKDLAGLVVDESFWGPAFYSSGGFTAQDLLTPLENFASKNDENMNELSVIMEKFVQGLRSAEGGRVKRKNLTDAGLTSMDLSGAIQILWSLKQEPKIWPGMPKEELTRVMGEFNERLSIRAIKRLTSVLKAARELLDQRQDEDFSGRMYIQDKKIRVRGFKELASQYVDIPALLIDATLPSEEILKKFFKNTEIVADISVTLPECVKVRQVLGGPFSKGKLSVDRNRDEIIQTILRRWQEAGRPETVVITQKIFAQGLIASGRLPQNVTVLWYNAIAGIDAHRDCGLLLAIGRPLPPVYDVEAYASALSGIDCPKTRNVLASGGRWYDREDRFIRLRNGRTRRVVSDVHPDPLAERFRWQICEGEIIQAIGRARAVGRTPDRPLQIDIMADIVLPITVDEATYWEEAPKGRESAMVADGAWIESPADMAKIWPGVWETEEAAKNFRKRMEAPDLSAFSVRARYKLPGNGQRWREARFDPSSIQDPRGWLVQRLGDLADFDVL